MSSRGRDSIDPGGGQPYSAAAMSLVFHSAHPLIPTLRADVRLFEVEGRAWFGGGCDLTPFYLFDQDATQFHGFWKEICDRHDAKVGHGMGVAPSQAAPSAGCMQLSHMLPACEVSRCCTLH